MANLQSEIIDFLSSPTAHGGAAVERIETHASVVFLAGNEAWKLKKAVKYPYLDYSTRERRRWACGEEVRLNRRTAPDIYLGAVALRRDGMGGLFLDRDEAGEGEDVDWLVHMRRFDQRDLLVTMARENRLDRDLMLTLADRIADFHGAAERTPDLGGRDAMRWVVDDNIAELRGAGDLFDRDSVDDLERLSSAALTAAATALERRRGAGFVRHCHGDLHLGNICLINGRPTLFDGIEFDRGLACIDTFYDLSFLLMDLAEIGETGHANRLLNRYLDRTGDYDGVLVAAAVPILSRGGTGQGDGQPYPRLAAADRSGIGVRRPNLSLLGVKISCAVSAPDACYWRVIG